MVYKTIAVGTLAGTPALHIELTGDDVAEAISHRARVVAIDIEKDSPQLYSYMRALKDARKYIVINVNAAISVGPWWSLADWKQVIVSDQVRFLLHANEYIWFVRDGVEPELPPDPTSRYSIYSKEPTPETLDFLFTDGGSYPWTHCISIGTLKCP